MLEGESFLSNNSSKSVRTRFAPSPTGPLHIGGVRSALFGWLYARHHGGQFILRIEDTDQKRFVEGSIELITDGLSWLGINWDEGPGKDGKYGPYIQSERLELYQKWANWLIEQGKAYKCFATPEELEEMNSERKKQGLQPGYDRRYRDISAEKLEELEASDREFVIRFKMPLDGKTVGTDMIRGDIEFDNEQLQDAVLLKSDGFPTYHLAHIVDDYFMEISHVTRAVEWLPSFPLHVQIWDAFCWEKPEFAHLPVLLNPNGEGKISKRKTAFGQDGQEVLVLVHEYMEAGYLPEAILNFLTNIGWNFGDDREIFSVQEAIERFDLKDVNPANSAFPIEKLEWMNAQYIQNANVDHLAKYLKPILERAGYSVDDNRLRKVVPLLQVRLKSLNDVTDMAGFFFDDWEAFQAPPQDILLQKKMDVPATQKVLTESIPVLEKLSDFDHQTQHEAMAQLATNLDMKNGQVFGTLRAAVTGQKVSPPTFETMEILGKDESIRRLKLAQASLN